MHFAVLPPEVNSGRMYAGSGAGSMLAAAAAWDELANELHTTAANLESVSSGLTSEPWQGPSAASMAAAAEPQLEWLNTTAAQTTQSSNQANAAVAAYESAYAMTVPPPVVAANRAELTSLIATNLLGQNTAAIAATEVAYGEMWAQDVAAMYSYAGESQAASAVTPFAPPEQTTNQEGLSAQSAAAAQAAGTSAGNAQTALSSGDVMSAVPNALQTLTSSSSGLSAFSNPYDLASLGSGFLGNGLGLIGLSGAVGFITDAEHKVAGPETGARGTGTAGGGGAGVAPPRPGDNGVGGAGPSVLARGRVGTRRLGIGSPGGAAGRPSVTYHESCPNEWFKSWSIQRNARFWRRAIDVVVRTWRSRFPSPPTGRQERCARR
jgi:PPE-repeat protein